VYDFRLAVAKPYNVQLGLSSTQFPTTFGMFLKKDMTTYVISVINKGTNETFYIKRS